MKNDPLHRSQFLYIIQAALEYFVAILMAGSYLATLTNYLGISDSVTGIISSIISLGCVFQLLSAFLNRKRVKNIVILFSVLNQLLFMMLYVVPLTGFAAELKSILFVVMIVLAYVLYNAVMPLKTNWLMSLIEDHARGIFTARKEIVSLLSGMIFTFATGRLIDHFRDSGCIETALIICGVVVFVLNVMHTLLMIFIVEPDRDEPEKRNTPIRDMFVTLKDKDVQRITGLFCLWNVAAYAATPFYGSYQIKELGFSLTFISVLSIAYSILRALCSTRWGKFADRNSFAKVLQVGLVLEAFAYLVNVFTVPSNGKIFYTVYYMSIAIATAGLNSAKFNLIFDYIPSERRSNALAVSQSLAGVVGFVTTLVVSRLVAAIQANGNSFFGLSVYAQQVCSLLACLLTLVLWLYVTKVIVGKMKRLNRED